MTLPASAPPAKRPPRTALAVGIGIGALVLLAIASLLINTLGNSSAPAAAKSSAAVGTDSRSPAQPVDIVILHTNDTWGYLLPCG